ncbi:homoserine O-acetyltransferase [Linnemannia elongata AG-77]|uniref:Homoserine O-acetyltransferase n=1 Tax=Linnemannia elongata AG-77 TaxID=1314771 RepID=A0A197KFK0_9FUNG|nr:homoserine O-acetyltransferase [Linnemannia elongata AG-77]
MPFECRTTQPENPFASLAPGQTIAIVPEFTFESGHTIREVPVAYKTWGVLNEAGDNCMLVCHPLSRSVDVEDWWVNLMGASTLEGKGKVIDETKFYIVCLNCMGSPYGSASPLTTNPDIGARYGPEFPLATIRDDCRLHKIVLDELGVKSVAICIGASMAGMHAFEWAFFRDTQGSSPFVKSIVPISAPAKSSAWSMSWTEAQRQAIFADPRYLDGYYPLEAPPLQGMTAARMAAMLTYRTRDSYERRFGRDIMPPPSSPTAPPSQSSITITAASTSSEIHRRNHNEGHRHQNSSAAPPPPPPPSSSIGLLTAGGSPKPFSGTATINNQNTPANITSGHQPQVYSAHSYLRYQAAKFNERFDANCYIALSRKMDAHDVSYNRGPYEDVVRSIEQPVLVIVIDSDVLYTSKEIKALSELLPNGEHFTVKSDEGHDGVLLEYEQINDAIVAFMQRQDHIRELVRREGVAVPEKKTPCGSLFASW